MGVSIYTLPSAGSSSGSTPSPSLRDSIEAGLIGTSELTIPGSRPEDEQWAFKRSVPTLVLYDEQGLRLYDEITSHAHEYYLFEDELNLLKTHGSEIARSMGIPNRAPKHDQDQDHPHHVPEKRWRVAKWGESEVGKWNNGVNGEEGLGGGWEKGWDVVELGAGALRKTAHLLTALSSALPATTATSPAPITYHPLDLSYPELHRVLGEMNDGFGSDLAGKVDCIGLHGDYTAGLEFIRQGRLSELRQLPTASLDLQVHHAMAAKPIEGDSSIPFPSPRGPSPLTSPLYVAEDLQSPPSAITDVSSILSKNDSLESSGTWSPVVDDDPSLPPNASTRPLHLVFLGSSLGNFERETAAPFLKSLPLKRGDTLLLGLDGRPAPGKEGSRKVEIAYNDPAGYTKAFEEHGWDVVRQELGIKGDAGVEFVGRYNEVLGRHEAYFKSKATQTIHLSSTDVTLIQDELLNIEWSYKYSTREALDLFAQSDLRVVNSWKAPNSEYHLWLLERPHVSFATGAMPTEAQGIVPSIKGIPQWSEWVALWKLWDHITLSMCPREMLHVKPIDLRHICLFYLGHIPTFLDIHLTRLTGGAHTEPEFYKDIFERGIDPDVDDPTLIHAHSEVPVDQADWPMVEQVIAFRDRVRARLRGIYDDLDSGKRDFNRHTARVLFMVFEHEAMHAETLLYMLAQAQTTVAPSAGAIPDWHLLAKTWQTVDENKILSIPATQVTLGHNDGESQDRDSSSFESHEFGWDNESPATTVSVAPFRISSLPISNAEYRDSLVSTGGTSLPASWISIDGEWQIRTFFGPVGFDVAGSWPLMASKCEIEDFAKAKNGRLPTEPELRALWESDEGPRVAGAGANIGFRNWHPIPPTNTTADNAGGKLYGHNGGVWEWTSTEFAGLPGFEPSALYPGYSADFFDHKHYVVLGGSYATVPQIAARKSFRNWYQGNYPYSFIGGRIAYDAE